MRRITILLLAASFLAAGCLDDDNSGDDIDDEGDPSTDDGNQTADGVKVTQATGTIAAGAGTPVISFQNGGASHTFTVGDNGTAILVELIWSDDTMDLDLALKEPDTADDLTWQHQKNEGSAGAPDNPHSIQIDGPKKGTWEATAFPNGPAAQTEFTIYASVFTGPIPDGYSAIP